jgi:crotonobetainyl-CoA:carnitine CoA-transferase CaiB-like acyl-CoA transferase
MPGARAVSGTLPLTGLSVVELCDTPAGEYTGKLLADLGAEVVKVEPPGGVTSRRHGPWIEGTDTSLAFWAYNTSKRSVVLDDSPADRATRDRLIARADVLLSTTAPGELAAAGLDYDALTARHPRLVVVSLTAFGLTGPWADYRSSDLIGLATGGPLHSCGYDDHSIPPILPGGNQAHQLTASFAWCGLLLALLDRERTGRGQLVDVSMHEACAVSGELANPYWFYPRVIVQRQTNRHAQPVPTEPASFVCGDGVHVYFTLILADPRAWTTVVEWMDAAGLAADLVEPAWSDLTHRQTHYGHIKELLEVFFLLQDSETAYREGQRRGLPIGPLRSFEDLPGDEHLQARGFFVRIPAGTPAQAEPITYPGLPYRFSTFSAEPGPAPRLGADQPEVAS